MAVYTRQSSFADGDTITAALFNNEFNQLLAAFNVSTGHTHDGSTTGDGGPLSTLFSNAISFGTNADTDIVVTFNANTADGVLTWMEDEDYFQFSDDLLLTTTEKLQFRDTAIYINSSADGQLDLVADTEIQIAATTVDINGNVDVSGTLTVAGNTSFGDANITNVGSIALDSITNDGTDITLDSSNDIVIDAEGGNIEFKDAGTLQLSLDMDGTSGVQIVKLGVDTDDLVFQQYDGNEVVRIADDRRLYFFDKGGEYIYGDGTDLHIVSGADINIPASIGLTFGDDGEKIEGDGTDLTITGNNIKLTATADVVLAANTGLVLDGTGNEKIESDGTDISISVGSGGDINIPADIGVTFGNDGEKIEGDGTDLTISGNNINLTASTDVVIPTNIGLHFTDSNEKIESDGTDLTINSGNDINLTATTDINVPANVGVTFGDDAEKIEGDGTDLTISGNNINLTATADVNIPSGVGLTFATAEKIESDGTDLSFTVGSGGDINIPANIGLTFGDDGEKIEGDGTDLVISANNLTIDAAADIVLDADDADVVLKDAGTQYAALTNSSGNLIIKSGSTTMLTGSGANATFAGNVSVGGNLDVTGSFDMSDADIANIGSIALDTITNDGTDITLDSSGDIVLDAAGNNVTFKSAGTSILDISNSSSDAVITSSVQDKDIIFKGDDGGSAITALTLDMSAAGAATFNDMITAVGTSVFTNLDISGDVDVDGTTNLDVVDIDGAVDIATTLTLGGNADFNGDLDVDGTANLDVVDIDGAVDMATTLTLAGNADFNGDLDVDGTTNLDVVDIDGAVDMASTLAVTGIVTLTDDLIIGDGKTIGSASDVDAIAIGSDGDVTLTQDLELQHDGAILSFGANDEVSLTHVHDTGILLNSTNVIQFNDASQNIGAPSATVLDINATDEIELNATLVDANANLDVSGTYTGGGLMTTGGNIVIPDAGTIGSASDTDAIAIASNGKVTLTQELIGTALDISGDIDIDGTSNLDALDVDGATNFAADVTFADGADIITASAGTSNTRIGVNTGNSIASGGNYNVVIGDEAGTALTTGDNNVAIGFEALKTEDAHGQNVAVGHQALKTQDAGANAANTAVGYLAGTAVTTGVVNTLIGGNAGDSITSGGYNTAIGYSALSTEDTGNRSTAMGYGALSAQNNDANNDNTALGYTAGTAITTGINNTIMGSFAGDALTDADANTVVGVTALTADTKGDATVAVGYGALAQQNFTTVTTTRNTAVGTNAGYAATTGTYNTFLGNSAGDANTDADYNVAVGANALTEDELGSQSTAVGYGALQTQDFGTATNTGNTAVGYEAGKDLTTGTGNVFIGSGAGDDVVDAHHNTVVGQAAMTADAGDQNTVMGQSAMNVGTGEHNTVLGYFAGGQLSTGSRNLIIGHESGSNLFSNGLFQCTTHDDRIILGTTEATNAYIEVAWTVVSDARDKTSITDIPVGLNLLNELRPVSYQMKKSREDDTPVGRTRYGFLAQEVMEIEGDNPVIVDDEEDELLKMTTDNLVAVLVKSVQELSAKVEDLENNKCKCKE